MKAVYTKTTSDPTVGHLYEHIFCDHIVEQLRTHGLFSYVDYHMSAKNYHEGYIQLAIETYTEQATALLANINDFEPIITDDAIDGAMLQILAEIESDVTHIDSNALIKELEALRAAAWSTRDGVASTLTQPAITHERVAASNFGTIPQTITLDLTHVPTIDPTDAAVLFVIISKAIRSNLQEDIANSSFCFTYEDSFIYNKATSTAVDTNLYRIDKRQATSITDEPLVADTLLENMKKHGFAERLSVSLRNATPADLSFPNIQEISTKVSAAVSPEDIQRVFTQDNIELLLENSVVRFAYSDTV